MIKKCLYEQIASMVNNLECLCRENDICVNVFMELDRAKTHLTFDLTECEDFEC